MACWPAREKTYVPFARGAGLPELTMVTLALALFVLSVIDVAMMVTLFPLGTAMGAV